MSTKFDILDAKAAYLAHLAEHHCRIGKDKCPIRIRLMKAYNGGPESMAHKWGLEYGDDTRQREQSAKRVGGLL